METIKIDKDIPVFYVTASSFPDGILAAHQQLHSFIPYSEERRYFGISRPEHGNIVYRAAAEELSPGEGSAHNCDVLILERGNYIRITCENYLDDLDSINRAFKQLLSRQDLDPEGYCVEQYMGKDVCCMIRLNN